MLDLRRRQFLTLLSGAAATWPLAARAQQPPDKTHRIGFLVNDRTISAQPSGQAFLDGLRESGFVEGQNIVIERRFAEGRLDRYADLVAELVRLNVDLLVTSSDAATQAAKQATRTIPIVMLNVTDPVGQGLVPSLAHPKGNITGLAIEETVEIAAKRMQLLKTAVPQVVQVAVLMNPEDAFDQNQWQQLQLAGPAVNVKLRQAPARQASELERAFAAIATERADALFVARNGVNFANRRRIMELAAKGRLPAMSGWREVTEVGGLMSYGFSVVDPFRRAAIYVGKILKGATPADLPVEQPIKYDLVINLKTAQALGIAISDNLRSLADEVIE